MPYKKTLGILITQNWENNNLQQVTGKQYRTLWTWPDSCKFIANILALRQASTEKHFHSKMNF